MQRDDRVYLGHMLDTARKALLKIKGRKQADCEKDEDFCIVLAYLVQIFGEAANRVSVSFRKSHPEIPWNKIIATRHKIVHDYLSVDFGIVLGVVFKEFPALLPALEKYVTEENNFEINEPPAAYRAGKAKRKPRRGGKRK